MPAPCEADWRRRVASSPFSAAVSFDGDHLVLGSSTVLYKLGATAPGSISLRPDAAHDRMVALLAVAGRGRVAKAALTQLAAALDDWRRGERGLAAIRLAFAPLPRLGDRDDAYGLFLAETALDAGLSPNDLLKALGYSACTALLKFDPNQPRVPAGSGSRSGQWTSGDPAGGTPSPASVPTSSRSASASAGPAPATPAAPAAPDGPRAIPIFLPPEPEGEDEEIKDKERQFGIGESPQERIDEGQPLRAPVPGRVGPSTPGFPDFGEPAVPETGTVPLPSLKPSPGDGGTPPPNTPPDDKGPDENGSECPEQQKDRPRGANANADTFEYLASLIVNPLNPTPKQSPQTPNVVSQAYYLPTSTPDGKTSYDDCKQDATPITIPGVRPGDMFEFKSGDFWQLFYTDSQAYKDFLRQVENQNAGVEAEGLGRKIYYCFSNETYADRAYDLLYNKFPDSRFLVCQ